MILVDDEDNFLGYAPRGECHTGKGKRHRAFVLMLYNKDKKILLQHRKHKLFDKLWDLTGASHPLHVDGTNESYLESASRCLKTEWRIEGIKLKVVGAFNYFSQYDEHCENEHCALIIGEYNGEVKINSDVAYDFRWVSLKQILSEVKKNPENFTPWLKDAIKLLNNTGFEKRFL